ncbi:hypothetical protein M569_15996, partial [Genlisea aurea]
IRTADLLLAVAVFVAINVLRRRKYHGLPNWPFLGMMPSLFLAVRGGNIYDWLTDVLAERNGTFVFRGPWFTNLNCVVTADPINLEYILKTRFVNFPKGVYFRDTVRDLLGDGIFSADGEIWRRQRKPASVEFHTPEFRRLTVDSLVELVHDRLLPVLDDSAVNSAIIDLQDILLRLTFDNVCMIAFGIDPGCLRPTLPEVPFARAFEAATEDTTVRFLTPTLLWKSMRLLGLGRENRLKRSIEQIDDFAQKVIGARRKEVGKFETKPDILTAFMGLRDDEGRPFPDKFLRDICVNFILAGRDTSSVALTWFFWLLDAHPDAEARVLEEIDSIVEERGGEERDSPVFRAEEVKKMEYLHAALSETLRLYPSVPVDHKEAAEDEEFPDGTALKKGAKVVYSIYSMGRSEGIWGKDCKEFRPERWLREGRFVGESAYRFAAFNGGPRLCLGKDFAYYQMKFVAASVLRRHRIRVVENYAVVPKMALTMYVRDGLRVRVTAR